MSLKDELQSVISGNGSVRNGKVIQSITSYLRREKETIPGIKKEKFNKAQEEEITTQRSPHHAWFIVHGS